jgi:hypothetical protein
VTADPAGGPQPPDTTPPADLLAALEGTLDRLRVFTEQLRAAAQEKAGQ